MQRHRRKGGVVATAVAGGLAFGLLVFGCADREADDAREGASVRIGGRSGQAHGAGLAGLAAVDPVRALAAVREAPRALARAGGAKVRTFMETASGGTRLTIQGRGAYDFERPIGRLTVLLPEDAAGAAEHRPITEVFTPGALYMKNRGAGVPVGKWVRLEAGELADGDLLTSGATDPLAAAELLGGAGEVAYMRDEQIDDARVAHYWGTIDLERAAASAPERDRSALAAAAKGFSSGTVAFDAYLDRQGRPRLLRYRFSVGGGSRGGAADGGGIRRTADGAVTTASAPMTVVSTVELSSFGPQSGIYLPAPGDIYAGTVASPQK
ncbi:hypothetical protein FHS39_001057 [Streptomyces olivoverticillatus]|uniref:Lipoprotein n=1 Tax=Streptomyces olivoverticillatus TaxID=66427 RepID=A0A7W7LLL8_9ACTN|nr:hypothetical protein [Streptomyces olivoverticillatus]